jgi:hypothetical protein
VKVVQQKPEYKDYLDAFEKLEIFSHFSLLKSWSQPSRSQGLARLEK